MADVALRRRLTKAERQAVYDKMGGHCAYCGCEMCISEIQVDHVIPMELYEAYAAIGQDLNDEKNLLPACRSCNNYKHSLTLEKFRAAIERMPTVLARDSVTYRNAVRFGMVTPTPKSVVFYFERMALSGDE